MGRIDEALKRANVDASEGTGAPLPVPAPAASPWAFEQPGRAESAHPAAPAPREASPAARPADEAVAGGHRSPRWHGFDAAATERLVVSDDAPPLLVEQFRSLAATLHQAQNEQSLKSVMVTSPSPGDGKSHVAVNLALTLSDSYGRNVLLIDGDLRRPSLHRVFGLRNTRGLSEVLKAASDERAGAIKVGETLTLLPAGKPEPNPLGALSSDRMKRLVADAAAHFDWVIVDSPPVGVLADARLVCEAVDGAIVVVRAGATRFPDLQAAADTLGRERILGIVFNAVAPIEIQGEAYYRRYYYGRDADHGEL